jgi:hypothetical protein
LIVSQNILIFQKSVGRSRSSRWGWMCHLLSYPCIVSTFYYKIM